MSGSSIVIRTALPFTLSDFWAMLSSRPWRRCFRPECSPVARVWQHGRGEKKPRARLLGAGGDQVIRDEPQKGGDRCELAPVAEPEQPSFGGSATRQCNGGLL